MRSLVTTCDWQSLELCSNTDQERLFTSVVSEFCLASSLGNALGSIRLDYTGYTMYHTLQDVYIKEHQQVLQYVVNGVLVATAPTLLPVDLVNIALWASLATT